MARKGGKGRGGLRIPGAGLAIRTLRNRQGLTLTALAIRLGWSKGRLSRYENDRVAPSVETIEEIAGALKIPAVAVSVECLRYVYPLLANPDSRAAKLLDQLAEAVQAGQDKTR